MAANLAIVDDCILASMEHAGTIGPRSVTPRISSEKPLARGVHFACGYLSPYFITDPSVWKSRSRMPGFSSRGKDRFQERLASAACAG